MSIDTDTYILSKCGNTTNSTKFTYFYSSTTLHKKNDGWEIDYKKEEDS